MAYNNAFRRALACASSPQTLAFALAGFGLAVAGAVPAFAQSANAPVNLDLGSVLATGTATGTSDYQDTPGAAPYEAPSVTPLNSTQPTSVVNKHTIENNFIGSQSWADIASLTPSVSNISPNGPGLMESTGPTIRGFTDGYFNVTFDGIPIGDSNDFTHHTTSVFMTNDIGETIVDRGPGTAETVGDATFGGTISVRTKDPLPDTTLTPYGEYGSYYTGLEGLELDTGAIQAANGTSAIVDGEHLQSSGALTYAHQERSNFFSKVVIPVSSNTTITLLAMYNKLYQNPSIGATLDQIGNVASNFAYNDNPNSQSYYRYNDDHITTDMEYIDITSNLSNGWLYDGKVYTYAYYHRDLNGDDPDDFSSDGSPLSGSIPNQVELVEGQAKNSADYINGVPGETFSNSYRSVGTIQRLEKDFSWGDVKTGVWLDHQVNTRFVTEVDITDGNGPDYNYNDANGKITANNNDGQIVRLQHNQLYTFQPYAQFDYQPISGLTLTGGVKYAFFKRALDAQVNQKTEITQGYTHEWGKFLPSFEAKYSFNPNVSAYAQVAEGFLAPNLNTLYVSDLSKESFEPETTWNYQTGAAYQDERLALGGDIYLIHFNNYITSTGSGNNKVFINAGGAVFKGIEGEATYDLGYGLSIFGNAGLNKANFTIGNAYVPQAPQFTANSGLIYDDNGIYGSIMDQWVGGEYDANGVTKTGGTLTNPRQPGAWYNPYNVVNISAGYTFDHLYTHVNQLKVKLNLDNITNQKQIIFSPGQTVSGENLFYTLPGVSAFVTVTVPLTF
jgi:iron complex outermembrane receptor protein